MGAAETFGIVHIGTANFLAWFDTEDEAQEELSEWLSDTPEEEFAIIGFDAEGMPV